MNKNFVRRGNLSFATLAEAITASRLWWGNAGKVHREPDGRFTAFYWGDRRVLG